MPVFTTSAATDAAASILQRDYLPGIQAQLNSATVLSDRLQRAPKHKFRGNLLELAVHNQRGVTQTVANLGTGDDLPPLSKQGFDTATYDIRELAHRVGYSALGLARTEDAPNSAFVDLLEAEMQGARDDMMQERNRQWFGDNTGQLTNIPTDYGSDTVTVTVGSTRFLREGAPIVVADANGADAGTGPNNTISSITSGTEVVLAISIQTSSDFIYHRNGATTILRGSDQNGLAAIVATTNPTGRNIGNIDRTAAGKRYWQANVLDNGGTNRALSSALLKQGKNLSWRRGARPTVGLTNDAVMLEYGAILAADKRYPGEFVTLDGGWEALNFAGTPIIADKDATANSLYWLHEPDLMIAQIGEVQFEDRDGSIFFRVSDKHQFESLMYVFSNLAVRRCNSHTVIKDIQEDFQTHNL